MAQIIRVGVIGAGKNTTSRHIPLLQKIPGVEIVAVANRTVASSERVCKEFNIPNPTDDPSIILNDEKIDAVVIGTWPYKHKEYSCEALKRGKHVMVEARIAMNAKEAEEMVEVSKRYPKLVTQVVPAPMTLACEHLVVEYVKNKIGKLVYVELNSNAGTFPDYTALFNWRNDPKFSGNNIMYLGIYYETLLRWVPPAETVFANSSVVVAEKKDESGQNVPVTIPDLLTVTGKLKSGSHYTINISHVSGFNKKKEVWLYGNEGTLKVDIDECTLSFGKKGSELELFHSYEKASGWRVEEEFISAIRGLEPIRYTTWEVGVLYMKFVDAVWESIKSGRLVHIT